MPPRITNDRIFIDTPTQNDKTGLELHSKYSHRLRSIASFALQILCCRSGKHRLVPINGKDSFNKFYFSFETFEVKVDGKVFYVKKEAYLNWKDSYYITNFTHNSFSKDFLSIIESSKVTPIRTSIEKYPEGKNPPDGQNPPQPQPKTRDVVLPANEGKEAIVPVKKIAEPPKDANALVEFFTIKQMADNEVWKNVIPATNNEVVKEAIGLHVGKMTESDYRFGLTAWIKKLYPQLDEHQKEFLLNTLPFRNGLQLVTQKIRSY